MGTGTSFQTQSLPVPQLHQMHIFNYCSACRLQIPSLHGDRAYYSFQPHPKWLCVVLDTFDLSVCGQDTGSERHRESENFLRWQQVSLRPMLADSLSGTSGYLCQCTALLQR